MSLLLDIKILLYGIQVINKAFKAGKQGKLYMYSYNNKFSDKINAILERLSSDAYYSGHSFNDHNNRNI